MRGEDSKMLGSHIPPAARPLSDFSVTSIGVDEYAMCDISSLEYHTLNQVAFEIWRNCDGIRSVDEIAQLATIHGHVCTAESVLVCLIDLENSRLITSSIQMPDQLVNRRSLIVKIAAAGIAGALLPAVRSITTLAAMCTTPICGGTYGETDACNSSEQCATCCCCSNGSMAICKVCEDCKVVGNGFDCLEY